MQKATDADIIEASKLGVTAGARSLNLSIRQFHHRRRCVEAKLGISLESPFTHGGAVKAEHRQTPERQQIGVRDGMVLIGSDWHIWPGPASLMQRAMLAFAKEFKPLALVANGDVLDFCSISRHPPIGWENQPTPQEEIEAAQDQLHALEMATPRNCVLLWTLGNHDMRFESTIASKLPELAKLKGIHLKDHFNPRWIPCWSVWINDVVVKHRWKGGIHAGHNNTLGSGRTMVTGHLHSAKVTPYTDYDGDRYGVDTGCMADVMGPQFLYIEDNPRNWRQAFCVLTFKGGRLLPPELVTRWSDDEVVFRGETISV